MELTPAQQELQAANRAARAKAAARAGTSEGEAAAWGLSPVTASFFSILGFYGGTAEEETAINLDDLREEWERNGDNTDELMTEVRVHDLVDVRENGGLYITELGREALQFMF